MDGTYTLLNLFKQPKKQSHICSLSRTVLNSYLGLVDEEVLVTAVVEGIMVALNWKQIRIGAYIVWVFLIVLTIFHFQKIDFYLWNFKLEQSFKRYCK